MPKARSRTFRINEKAIYGEKEADGWEISFKDSLVSRENQFCRITGESCKVYSFPRNLGNFRDGMGVLNNHRKSKKRERMQRVQRVPEYVLPRVSIFCLFDFPFLKELAGFQ